MGMSISDAEKILGLSGIYDKNILKKQYRMLVKKYHPDSISETLKNGREEMIRKVNEAYSVLEKYLDVNKCGYSNYNNDVLRLMDEIKKLKEEMCKRYKDKSIDYFKQKYGYFNGLYGDLYYYYFTETLTYMKNICAFLGTKVISLSELKQVRSRFYNKIKELFSEFECKLWSVYVLKISQNNCKEEARIIKDEFFCKREYDYLDLVLDNFLRNIDELNLRKQVIRDNYNKKIENMLNDVFSEVSNYAFYDKVRSEICDLERRLINIINRESSLLVFEVDIDAIVNRLEKIVRQKILDIFNSYADFLNNRDFIVSELKKEIEESCINLNEKVNLLGLCSKLLLLEDRCEFDNRVSFIRSIISFLNDDYSIDNNKKFIKRK